MISQRPSGEWFGEDRPAPLLVIGRDARSRTVSCCCAASRNGASPRPSIQKAGADAHQPGDDWAISTQRSPSTTGTCRRRGADKVVLLEKVDALRAQIKDTKRKSALAADDAARAERERQAKAQ